MNWALRIRPRARLEIVEAVGWYAEQGNRTADNFMKALDVTLLRMRENPMQYQVVHGELRRAGLHRFPYAVIYTVMDREVIVLGVVHGHRDPRRWRNRM
ncbi:MAG: type II toxin-antitoxin system RelE/ParE family toxin [Xanthobacteraceae bacterium]